MCLIMKLFVQVTYRCQGSKGLEMKTVKSLVLVMETSECRIHWKGLENMLLGTPINTLENNSNFKGLRILGFLTFVVPKRR
jgi:hypothetical protein